MARKTKTVVIESGRDNGKSFLVTEMPVTKADKWANTALLAMMRGGVDVGGVNFDLIGNTLMPSDAPKIDVSGGMLELARISIAGLGNVTETVGQSLLDQLIEDCVQVVPTGGAARPMLSIDDEIEDLKTLWTLRKEAFILHIDFLADGSSQT
nr:MAG TPA: hypothetical protein [Caudoviricetes sp.]